MWKLSRTPARPGFTLVELMVVIGIITLLAAILVVAIGRAGVTAREKATAAIIKKVSGQVQERLEAFDRLKSQRQIQDLAKSRGTLAVSGSYSDQQLRAIGFKILMREQFPQSHEELRVYNNADYLLMTASPTYTGSGPSATDPTESSECLYFFLTKGKALGIPTVDPGEFKSSEVADTDNDGLLEFVDAWGKPLRFYRWPTRLFRPTGTGGTIDRTQNAAWKPLFNGIPQSTATSDPLAVDQDDPTLLLSNDPTLQPTPVTTADFNESQYHTPQTYHHFLIVSSGPDGQKKADSNQAFGLWPPNDQGNNGRLGQPYVVPQFTITQAFDALTDNITNRNR